MLKSLRFNLRFGEKLCRENKGENNLRNFSDGVASIFGYANKLLW